jgi:hypothetical protein
MNTPLLGVHESGRLVFMKPPVGGGDESKDSTATPRRRLPAQRAGSFANGPLLDQPIGRDRATVSYSVRNKERLVASPRDRSTPRSSRSPLSRRRVTSLDGAWRARGVWLRPRPSEECRIYDWLGSRAEALTRETGLLYPDTGLLFLRREEWAAN